MRLNGNLIVTGTIAGYDGGVDLKVKQVTSTASQSGSTAAITAFTALTFPSTPDGVKVFAVTVSLMMEQSADGTPMVKIHMGSTGDATDQVRFRAGMPIESNQSQSAPWHCGRLQLTPSIGHTITVSIAPTSGDFELNAKAGDRSNVIIEQIS
jgi:hypothetical protein